MRSLSILVLFAALILGSSALPPTADEASVLIGLRHSTPERGLAALLAISDPKNPRYGLHLSPQQVAEEWGYPSPKESALLIRAVQVQYGGRQVILSPSRDFIRAIIPRAAIASLSQHLMIEIVVDLTAEQQSPTNIGRLDARHRMAYLSSSAGARQSADLSERGPDAQKERMGMPADQRGTNPNNKQAVYGTGSYGFAASDLNEFYQWQEVNTTAAQTTAVGMTGNSSGDNYVECTIDLQMITSIGLGVPTLSINNDNSTNAESGMGFGPAMLDFVAQLSALPNDQLPLVLSMSLGSLSSYSCEYLCNQVAANSSYSFSDCLDFASSQFQVCMFTNSQEDRMNTEFQKLGARGLTAFAASGDGGAHFSFQPFPSSSELGTLLNEYSCAHILPTYPAASPFVVAVGGTSINTGITSAWRASGGAFSIGPSFQMLSFQNDAVSTYLTKYASNPDFPQPGSFDPTKRAYPDISALSSDLPLVINGRKTLGGGTSFAAPEVAGAFSLINDIRLNNGLPPLGFVSPRLYQVAADHPGAMFQDVVQGNNRCTSGGQCCDNGFPATPGWDAASGFGELNWPGMVQYLASDDSSSIL